MISCDLLVTGRFIYCYLLCNTIFTTAKTQLLSSSEYCQCDKNQNTIHGLTHDINSMPKLLYTWYFEKFTASVTSSGHSALRHEVSRMCTILTMSALTRGPEKWAWGPVGWWRSMNDRVTRVPTCMTSPRAKLESDRY